MHKLHLRKILVLLQMYYEYNTYTICSNHKINSIYPVRSILHVLLKNIPILILYCKITF